MLKKIYSFDFFSAFSVQYYQYICSLISEKTNYYFKHFTIMRKIYFLLIALVSMAMSSTANAAVVPYLPPLQNLGGSSVDLATFLPVSGDYTLEMQGTAGTPIVVAGGVLSYTPETTGLVRFAQKNGQVIVYEGNVYKTTLTATWNTSFPAIADATADTDPNNLLQNAGFETAGDLVGGTNYKFGAPWLTNVIVGASGGIRVTSATTGNVNGTWEVIWRGSGNSNYFSQQLASAVKPNTSYKVIINQLTGANAFATFNVGLGTTEGGLELGFAPVVLGNGKNGTWSVTFRTPLVISSPVYFTFKNTAANSSSSGTDPLTQIDYLALVEGTEAASGITGTASAVFVSGNAYAPANVAVDFAAGDMFNMTPYMINPGFEDVQTDKSQTIPGWTKTGPANSEFCTRNDAGPASFKTGNVYFQYWSSSRPDYSISQVVAGIPNGKYRLIAAAGGNEGTTGTFVYAGDKQTEVTSTGSDYSVDAIVVDGSLTVGFKSVSRTVSWSYADNFRLYYLGEILEPVLSASATSLFFDALNTVKTFTVTGANLSTNTTLTAPAGITLSATTLTPAEVAAGAEITATYDNQTAINDGVIAITNGTLNANIAVVGSADLACFTKLYPDGVNLIPNPYLNDISQFAGWGRRSVVTGAEAYCGARAVKFDALTNGWPDGAALDVNGIAWKPNTWYRMRAMVKTVDGTLAFFAKGTDPDVTIPVAQSNDQWVEIDETFKTGAAPTTNFFSLNNVDGGSTGKIAYIDNYELYELPLGTSIDNPAVESTTRLFVSEGKIAVRFNLDRSSEVSFGVYNLQGVLVASKKADLTSGTNQVEIANGLEAGAYIVKLNTVNGEETLKTIVR